MELVKSEFKSWIAGLLGTSHFDIQPLKGDASFRTYYRVKGDKSSYIAMLAPVEKEDPTSFVHIARAWKEQAILVPEIFGWDKQNGFVLLSDFGNVLLSDCLNPETVDSYYGQAMETLVSLQKIKAGNLPLFDANAIALELSYFEEWFLKKLLGLNVDKNKKALLTNVFETLINACLSQEQVCVHRDYHSRNIMILDNGCLGIIDFQDAVHGPITYDLVSLLKDCYINWPVDKVMTWVRFFYQQLQNQGKLSDSDFEEFYKGFHYVGLQRHLKVLGIFSRLKLRDMKPQYIQDMPRIMQYVLQVTRNYEDFQDFHAWLEEEILLLLLARCDEEKKAQVA